jgi:hypothetical protein
LETSAETIRKVVNEEGLGNAAPVPKRKPAQIRRFERSLPNALWQIDIFTFELKRMYRVYLVGIIDDHSRYIVGHGLFRQQTADAVLDVVRGAVGQWGAPREILSDNGRQFVAWRGKSRFQRMLVRQGIGHVRSAPQHPMTLGKIERFWKTLWDEFVCESVFASFADASQRLAHWVSYYNHQRPHQGIDGACPADRFYGVADDVEEAVRQGCQDNALRLALGQETRPPLFLLGQLGETDVKVTRSGENIEIHVGDSIHEVIRLGPPYTVDEQGHGIRQGAADEVEDIEWRGTLPGDRDGQEGQGASHRNLSLIRCEPSDALSGDGQSGSSCGSSSGSQESGSQGSISSEPGFKASSDTDSPASRGIGELEDEVRDGQGIFGSGASLRSGRGARDNTSLWQAGGKNSEPPKTEQASQGIESERYEEPSWSWEPSDDGEML